MISNAPSRLRLKARKTNAIKAFTQGLEPSCTTPKGPRAAVAASPNEEKRTIMPMQKTAA